MRNTESTGLVEHGLATIELATRYEDVAIPLLGFNAQIIFIPDLQVIIFGADHPLYTSAALIQISGRVGRKKDAPTGEVVFIAKRETNEMVEAVREIELANKSL